MPVLEDLEQMEPLLVADLLVSGFTGADGMDLDTNDDGVLDVTPWGQVLDSVGLYEGTAFNCTAGDEHLYTTTVVGPDGTFVPGHVFRCDLVWVIGPFDPSTGLDSPGSPNKCSVSTQSSTWGKLKVLYR